MGVSSYYVDRWTTRDADKVLSAILPVLSVVMFYFVIDQHPLLH